MVDNAKDIDVVCPMYNLIEYSHLFKNIWKFIAISWDEPALVLCSKLKKN